MPTQGDWPKRSGFTIFANLIKQHQTGPRKGSSYLCSRSMVSHSDSRSNEVCLTNTSVWNQSDLTLKMPLHLRTTWFLHHKFNSTLAQVIDIKIVSRSCPLPPLLSLDTVMDGVSVEEMAALSLSASFFCRVVRELGWNFGALTRVYALTFTELTKYYTLTSIHLSLKLDATEFKCASQKHARNAEGFLTWFNVLMSVTFFNRPTFFDVNVFEPIGFGLHWLK